MIITGSNYKNEIVIPLSLNINPTSEELIKAIIKKISDDNNPKTKRVMISV